MSEVLAEYLVTVSSLRIEGSDKFQVRAKSPIIHENDCEVSIFFDLRDVEKSPHVTEELVVTVTRPDRVE